MRTVLWMGGVVVAVAAVVGASRLWAESKEKKPAPRTRIGYFNLNYVIKNYEKYQEFQVTIKELIRPFQERDAELRSQLQVLRNQIENPSLVPTAGEDRHEKATKEELEWKAKEIQHQLEDNSARIKKKLNKETDQQMKILYMDLVGSVRKYAVAHDLDCVMHYNDAITTEDFLSAQNVARKLNTGALMPVYWKEEMDISQDLVAMLNQEKQKK
jgi:Skp family chaperone for outer membrane proteins